MMHFKVIGHRGQIPWPFEHEIQSRGAIEPYWHFKAFKSYQVTTSSTLNVCAKFSYVSSILCPSKAPSLFDTKNGLPRQQC